MPDPTLLKLEVVREIPRGKLVVVRLDELLLVLRDVDALNRALGHRVRVGKFRETCALDAGEGKKDMNEVRDGRGLDYLVEVVHGRGVDVVQPGLSDVRHFFEIHQPMSVVTGRS